MAGLLRGLVHDLSGYTARAVTLKKSNQVNLITFSLHYTSSDRSWELKL